VLVNYVVCSVCSLVLFTTPRHLKEMEYERIRGWIRTVDGVPATEKERVGDEEARSFPETTHGKTEGNWIRPGNQPVQVSRHVAQGRETKNDEQAELVNPTGDTIIRSTSSPASVKTASDTAVLNTAGIPSLGTQILVLEAAIRAQEDSVTALRLVMDLYKSATN
jgi:hypothetical protein